RDPPEEEAGAGRGDGRRLLRRAAQARQLLQRVRAPSGREPVRNRAGGAAAAVRGGGGADGRRRRHSRRGERGRRRVGGSRRCRGLARTGGTASAKPPRGGSKRTVGSCAAGAVEI